MLGLIAYNRANPYLTTQRRESVASYQPKTVSWQRTVAHSLPVFVRDVPHYFDLLGHSFVSPRADPLLVTYYSLLDRFKQYDPTIAIDPTVDILNPADFARLERRISIFLRNSKTIYYTDRLRQLHALLN
jgi:hypothetical protein